MINHRNSERGQALILIVFGLVGLIGAAALAIDGGSVYSDRRHAQNAADTAVMAAGLAKIRNPSDWSTAESAGFSQATDNGYDNNGATNQVSVKQCTEVGANCNLPTSEAYTDTNGNGTWDATEPYVDRNGNGQYDFVLPEQFVQVTIGSVVPTYFARVVGVPEINNGVSALAKAVPPQETIWYQGKALVAVMPACKNDDWPNDPFTVGGNSATVVNGSGVFVNSNCTSPPAFTQSGTSSTMTATGGICVVGAVGATSGINPPPDDYCSTQQDSQLYQAPAVDASTCTVDGTITDLGGATYVATPGNYYNSFPNVSPAGILKLISGVYCLHNGLALSGNWVITTDLDGDGRFDGGPPDFDNEGVMFYVPTGGVTFNGGSHVTIGAMNNPSTHPAVKGFLIYLPESNNSTVKLTGNNGSVFIGTILAPASLITLEGSNDTDSLTFECQVIGYSVKLGGNGTLNINYNVNKSGKAWTSPVLKLYR